MSQNQNQYPVYDTKVTSCAQERYYPLQTDEAARWLKKLCHELKRANRLSELKLYVRLMEIARERGDVFGDDWAAMMWGLKPQKRKRKKRSVALEGRRF